MEIALKFIAHLIQQKTGKPLSNLEVAIFHGAWEDLSYKQIAKNIKRDTNYLETNVGPELWKKISLVLGHTVRKKNFKISIELAWEHYQLNAHNNGTVSDCDITNTTPNEISSNLENNSQEIPKDVLPNISSYDSKENIEVKSDKKYPDLYEYIIMFFKLIIRLLSFRTLCPNLHDIFKDLAVDYQKDNQLFKSLIFYNLTKIANPQNTVHYALGSLYEAMNILPMAHKEYMVAIQQKQAYAYNNLARLYIFESQLEEAIQLLNTGLELAKNDEYIYIFYKNLGMAYMLLREYQISIVYLQQSIEIAPERSSVAYGLMARIMEKLGKFAEAEELWAKFRKYSINDHSPDVTLLKLC